MKKLILLTLAIVPAFIQAQSNNFTLSVKIADKSDAVKAYLLYSSGSTGIIDSAFVDHGLFKFTGQLVDPVKAQIVLTPNRRTPGKTNSKRDSFFFYIEKGHITLTTNDSVKNAMVTGSKTNADYEIYKAMLTPPEKAMDRINADYLAANDDQKKNQAFKDGLQARYDQAMKEKRMLQIQYIKQNPGLFMSLCVLKEIDLGREIDVPTVDPLFNSLSENVRTTATGLAFAQALEVARSLSVGAMAPLFTENDVNDKPVSLKDFRGKYVLVDFWASWCEPCRDENPNVVKAYNQFKNKNFTVLGVSLDKAGQKNRWLEAIRADGLEWTQVSDLKYWDNEVAKLYHIHGIPQNYLIDPTGKIVGKSLRGEELIKKLESILN
jgi:peroxiredoxin